jgi:hypothetical protein
VRARLAQNPVPIAGKVGSVSVAPRYAVLLKRVEQVVQDLGIRANGVGRMGTLHGMLVKKSDGWLDQRQLIREQERESNRPRLSQTDSGRHDSRAAQRRRYIGRRRQLRLTDDQNHKGSLIGSET